MALNRFKHTRKKLLYQRKDNFTVGKLTYEQGNQFVLFLLHTNEETQKMPQYTKTSLYRPLHPLQHILCNTLNLLIEYLLVIVLSADLRTLMI